MKRRDFLAVLGGAALSAWPLAVPAQRSGPMRRIGLIMAQAADDPDMPPRLAGFLQGLAQRGWIVDENVRIDYRWGASATEADRMHRAAAEVVSLAPDVIVANTGTIVGALELITQTTPIVFAGAIDPVGGGRVATLSRPGGNVTGFMSVEYSTAGKLLEVLKEVAPRTRTVAVARDPTTPGGIGQYAAIQATAPSLQMELSSISVRDPQEFERALTAFARARGGGLVVVLSALALARRQMFIKVAGQNGLPAVYPGRAFATDGGLVSYGPATTDVFRQAAGYVDRILKGEKPADLPVQAPTKYETVVNLKTAKALGLTIPPALLARADEVIE